MEQARAGRAGNLRGPLAGQPVLIKDNIESAGPLPTTAGSLALANNVTNRDAPLVARLRSAGAVILGKTNLSEWANIRSNSFDLRLERGRGDAQSMGDRPRPVRELERKRRRSRGRIWSASRSGPRQTDR